MTRYLTTRKRNIKKYKKSRTGRGKGRRSIRRCKTRKPKIFRKAKRHTVSKRRNMVGGVCKGYTYYIDSKGVKRFMPSVGDNLELIGFGIVLVTNASKSFLKEYNRPEQVAIFKDLNGYIYIARGKYPFESINHSQGVIEVANDTYSIRKMDEKKDGNLPGKDDINSKLTNLGCATNPEYVTYIVSNRSGMNYRICVYKSGTFSPDVALESSGHELTQEQDQGQKQEQEPAMHDTSGNSTAQTPDNKNISDLFEKLSSIFEESNPYTRADMLKQIQTVLYPQLDIHWTDTVSKLLAMQTGFVTPANRITLAREMQIIKPRDEQRIQPRDEQSI